MGSLEVQNSQATTRTSELDPEKPKLDINDDDISPVEEVRLTVNNTDDPTLPILTFRMWFIGLLSCGLLSFLNQFFSYRAEPLIITQIPLQIASQPIGHFLAAILSKTQFRIPGFGSRKFSLNPGPFNIKEHVLITIFANAGSDFGNGAAYAVEVVSIIKAYYKRKIPFFVGWMLIITTQVLGYGWAGLMRNFLWYALPGYLFTTLSNISWVCWIFSKSVTAQQLGSGMQGLGLGAITLDWSVVSSYLYSPLMTPFFAIANICAGYVLILYIFVPIAYWGLNLYSAQTFPILSANLFTAKGQIYNISAIVNEHFELDQMQYAKQGQIHMSLVFALTYGFGFAAIAATITHVALFYGREMYERFRESYKGKEDIHAKLMKNYKDIPSWWFYLLLLATTAVSLVLCIVFKDEVQIPWWALLFACAIAFIFTLPISIITATTNQTPGLNIITEYIMGVILPGRPIANVCFKVYGYNSMLQAVSFLSDFKLGHYMKIPPRSMFLVQFTGTILASTVNLAVAWWMLGSIHNICDTTLLPPGSPWTCANYHVFFDASVIWGLAGPKRIFENLGTYKALNWFFLGGALGPLIVWFFHKKFPKKSWIPLINLPVFFSATVYLPPASALNYNAWIIVGTIFNFFIFRYRKQWWQRYNYILSAALDAGVAFMAVVLYISL
ncbi:hypothetical protein KSS87_000587, partial [Heliosperma pusillum]